MNKQRLRINFFWSFSPCTAGWHNTHHHRSQLQSCDCYWTFELWLYVLAHIHTLSRFPRDLQLNWKKKVLLPFAVVCSNIAFERIGSLCSLRHCLKRTLCVWVCVSQCVLCVWFDSTIKLFIYRITVERWCRFSSPHVEPCGLCPVHE